jgi:hypothetical protein
LKNDGTVVSWGIQTNVPPNVTNVTALATGWSHTLALKSNGTVVAWGSNSDGQTNVPVDLANVVAIAGGDGHSLAVKSDGTIVAWGLNYAGEATVPSNVSDVAQIAGGGEQSLTLTPALQFSSIELNGQSPKLRFHTFSGRQYAVQFSPTLNPGSWTNLPGAPISGDGYDALVTDTSATVNAPSRYYRLRRQ